MSDQPSSPPWSTDTWRTSGGAAWSANATRLEAMLEPVLEPLFAEADLCAGERILDVGCGRAATTYAAARLVGRGGAVTAVDVSPELIAEAQAGAALGGESASIEWIVGDAQVADLGEGVFDAVVSRFGVMFFNDPVAAFSNLRTAARVAGRLSMATWQPRDACDFQSVGWDAIAAALVANGYELELPDPAAGPYSFGLDDHVRAVLTDAGWRDVRVRPVDLPLYYGGPGLSPSDAVETAMAMPGMQTFLGAYDEDASALASAALLDAYVPRHDGTGVRLDASILVTTARA
ncbi:MAG: methyltransferase domain-containing protein [Actinomycetota bacterium]